jgi:hypothetical protein
MVRIIRLSVQLQINIRQHLAVAESAEVEQLLSVDCKFSDEIELVIQLRSLFRQRLAFAEDYYEN